VFKSTPPATDWGNTQGQVSGRHVATEAV